MEEKDNQCPLCAAGVPRMSYTVERNGKKVEVPAHQSAPKGTGEFTIVNCPVRDNDVRVVDSK